MAIEKVEINLKGDQNCVCAYVALPSERGEEVICTQARPIWAWLRLYVRLRVVPHFSSWIVERVKCEHA